jgi:adenylate cyclase
LGGKYVDATVMFSDIRSFTTIVESQGPDETIELLNTYYTLMFEAISDQGGVVNQMVGDGLMSIFGAPLSQPDHCEHAVKASLDMIDMIQLLNLDRKAQGKNEIRIGIGIASGQVIAGYTGTIRRATYTCVGDTVNLAARLESHTKVVGKPILIDEATRLALPGSINVDPEGPVQLKGKTVDVQVFSVPIGQKK